MKVPSMLARKASTLHRLFFALLPPEAERARIAAVRDDQPGLRSPVADARLHLTLGLGVDHADYPAEAVAAMRAVGDGIALPPARVVLDELSASPGHVVLRPSHRLDRLHDLGGGLARAIDRCGLTRPGWRFSPHVTLGYRKSEPFTRGVAPIMWEADEFVLVHSLVGETRHIILARWSLRPPQAGLFD